MLPDIFITFPGESNWKARPRVLVFAKRKVTIGKKMKEQGLEKGIVNGAVIHCEISYL